MKIKKFLFVITTMFLMVQGASAWNGSGSSGDPYQITSTADWNTLASNVANGNTYSNTYFKLTADITVTTMVNGTFSGTFDGAGYTLTFTYTSTANNAAPFAHLNGGTIKNLRTAGTITAKHKFAAGIVAQTDGGTNNITNCWSSVTIDSSVSGDGTHGGLVGHNPTGTLNITNCLFDGKLLGANTQACGGIVGYRTGGSSVYIKNSLFAPAEVTIKTSGTTSGCAMFTRNGCDASTSYYKTTWAPDVTQGNNANSMTAEALVTALNNGNKNWCIHRGNAIPIRVNLMISTKAQWDTFAANVGNYDGKYVQLGANIGTANDPITTMTTKSTSFRGIFDGNGKTMTVNFSADTGNEGAFRYLNDGTIMNLTITGTVTAGGNYASGLVARTSGGDCLIDNCVVNTNVAGSGYAGGIVAHGDDATKLTITNCIYGGEISEVSSFSGGILGWYNNNGTMDLVINNCLCKGIYTGTADFHPIGLKRASDCSFKSISCINCYYTTNPHNPNGRNFTDGTKVSALTIGTTGVSIASGSYATFQGTKYYYGTVTLGYNGPMATTNFSLDGTHLNDNSFTISTDNAAFDDGTATIKWDFPGRGTEEEPYLIPSTEVWNYLADQVNGGNTYSGKFFQLTEDIGTEQNPITRMIGIFSSTESDCRPFSGTFDGNGHTLTVNYSSNDYETRTALFSYVKVATIRNLIVAGNCGTAGRAASIVGESDESDGLNTVTNCVSSVTISGGLVGGIALGGNVDIRGCLFNGTINGTSQSGGIVCWGKNVTKITNCLFAPQNGSSIIGGTFYYNGSGSATVTNCYYMTLLGDAQGKQARSITAGTNVTISGLGDATATYNVSGIIAYSHGIKYNTVYYAGSGDAVSLNLGYTPQSGYSFHSFTASGGTLTGESNPYTLTMAAANATINVRYSTSKSISAATSATNGWYLIASPMNEAINPVNVTNMTNVSYDIFRFNQSAEMEWQNWEQTGSHYHFDLEPGRGYLYANSSDVTLTFIGTPYSGNGQVSLSYSTANPDERMRGWNLIGNPFGVTATIENPFYRMNNAHNEIISAVDNNVAPMEGVFVHATAENQTVTFSTGAKRETDGTEDRIVINLNDTKGNVIDRAIVSFDEGHTLTKFQIRDNSTKLYIPKDGKDYAIAFAYRIGELPLNFKAQETGVYTLNFNGDNMTAVSLVDMIEGAIIDLSVNDTYTFIGTSADRADRFKLVFSSPNDSNIEIFAYQTGNEIVVSGEGELQAFDVMGRMVISQHINGVQTVTQPLQTGVYIFRLNEKSQKIVVR